MVKKNLSCYLSSKNDLSKLIYVGMIHEKEKLNIIKKNKNIIFCKNSIDFSSTKKLLAHYDICDKAYKILLKKIFNILNKIHQVKFTKKQWQIIIGEWLRQFIYIIYYNYNKLKPHITNKKKFKKIIYTYNDHEFLQTNLLDFSHSFNDKIWNEKLNGKILNFFLKNYKNKIIIKKKNKHIKKNKKIFSQNYFYKIFKLTNSLEKKNQPYIYKTTFGLINEKKLEMNFGFIPKLNFFPSSEKNLKINLDIRSKLKEFCKGNSIKHCDFELLVLDLLPIYLSTSYLEEFKKMNDFIENYALPIKPKYFLTSYNTFDEYFNLYMAKTINKKIPLVYVQHGNISSNDIKYKYSTENKIADYILTWGHKVSKKDIRLFNAKTFAKKKVEKNNNINLSIFSQPIRQHTCFSDISERTTNEIRMNFILKQLSNLNKKIKTNSYFNLFPSDSSSDKDYYEAKLKKYGFECYKSKNFLEINSKSKLNLFLYETTGFHESLALNVPCLVYLEKPFKNISVKYRSVYKNLINSQLIFTDLNKLMTHIEKIWHDPNKWWYSKDVRKSVLNFNNNMNLSNTSNFKKLIKILKNLEN